MIHGVTLVVTCNDTVDPAGMARELLFRVNVLNSHQGLKFSSS